MVDTQKQTQKQIFICRRDELKETSSADDGISGVEVGVTGRAIRFEIRRDEQTLPCFAVAFEGAIYAYRNRCPHQGTELDWMPGEVFDDEGLYLVCATHGALFEADSGLCVGGPCRGLSLDRIAIGEVENNVVLLEDILP